MRAALHLLLERRGLALSDEQRARILGCSDAAELERWIERAVVATSAAEVFA